MKRRTIPTRRNSAQPGILTFVLLLTHLSYAIANEISEDGGAYEVATATATTTAISPPEYCVMNITPPSIQWFQLHDTEWIRVNLTCNNEILHLLTGKVFVLLVTTMNGIIAQPKPTLPIKKCNPIFARCDQIAVHIGNHTSSRYFRITTESIGRANLTVEIVLMNKSRANAVKTDSAKLIQLPSQTIASQIFSIQVIRRRRLVDIVFDATIAGLAFVNSFGVGLLCDNEDLRRHYKKPLAAVAALICQLLFKPAVALGLTMSLELDTALSLGVILLASLPGGGMAHILVLLVGADPSLIKPVDALVGIISLGTAPLWVYIYGQQVVQYGPIHLSITLRNIGIWMGANLVPLLAGIQINHCKPSAATAILEWIIKPLLLLASILFATLGIHINMYMFNVIDHDSALVAFVLPICGFTVGGIVGILTRQSVGIIKAMAAEVSTSNTLLCLVILRFTLPQPDADLASSLPMWCIFFTVCPALFTFVIQRSMRTGIEYFEKRKEKEGNFSIASSLAQVTQVSALSTPFLIDDEDEDGHHRTNANEKVTVL